jgi:hypothetical protein
MRVLVTTTGGAGHLLPLVPIAQGLNRAGHDVRIACPASFTGFAQRYGLPVDGFGEPDPAELAAVWATIPTDDWDRADRIGRDARVMPQTDARGARHVGQQRGDHRR